MKKLTRKLFISILSMAFAVIAIGTTTFAWITVSNTAKIEQFSGQVEAGESGIELSWTSAETGQWYTSLDLTDSTDFTNFSKFSDLTSSDGKTIKEYVFGDTASTGDAAGKYIEVTFYMRRSDYKNVASGASDSDLLSVYVDSKAVSFETYVDSQKIISSSYTCEYDDIVDENPVTNLLVSNAARLSLSTTNYTAIYEQSSSTEDNTVNTTNEAYKTGFAYKYWVKKMGANSLPTYEASINTQQAGQTSNTLIAKLGNAPVAVTVRVWVEGWDNECHAQILNQTLKVALGFTTSASSAN